MRAFSASDFVYQALELVDVLETAIHAGVADVGHFVEFFEFAHHQFTDAAGKHFALPQVQQLFLDALDGAVDLRGAHGPLAQGQIERGQQLAALVFDAAAIFLDDGRKFTSGRS